MTNIDKINGFTGADWTFKSFRIDYERVLITLSNNSDRLVTICCNNFIGFSFIGHWDESTIKSIRIEPVGDLIISSLKEIKQLYGEPPIPLLGGGVKVIDKQWYQLNIKLIDGNLIKIACENFNIDI